MYKSDFSCVKIMLVICNQFNYSYSSNESCCQVTLVQIYSLAIKFIGWRLRDETRRVEA